MSIFIGKLPPLVTPEHLFSIFSNFGKVIRCDFKGKYAFIHFADERDADEAINQCNNRELFGCRIIVEWSKESGRYYRDSHFSNDNSCFHCRRCFNEDHFKKRRRYYRSPSPQNFYDARRREDSPDPRLKRIKPSNYPSSFVVQQGMELQKREETSSNSLQRTSVKNQTSSSIQNEEKEEKSLISKSLTLSKKTKKDDKKNVPQKKKSLRNSQTESHTEITISRRLTLSKEQNFLSDSKENGIISTVLPTLLSVAKKFCLLVLDMMLRLLIYEWYSFFLG